MSRLQCLEQDKIWADGESSVFWLNDNKKLQINCRVLSIRII